MKESVEEGKRKDDIKSDSKENFPIYVLSVNKEISLICWRGEII